MKRAVAAVAAVALLLTTSGAAVGAWILVRHNSSGEPEISAFSHGRATRVGPYFYCNVLDLNDCRTPRTQGRLTVDDHDPIQLSVPSAIGAAPWRLMLVYEDPADTTSAVFRPDTRLAITIPTTDPQRGRLNGLAVQLLTLGADPQGELREIPHAEWSVRTVWDD